jgi:hypothetical protein
MKADRMAIGVVRAREKCVRTTLDRRASAPASNGQPGRNLGARPAIEILPLVRCTPFMKGVIYDRGSYG